jgi:hypothetical protein
MATKQEAFEIACGDVLKSHSPIIKQIGFNPKPVAGKIPIFADTIVNPKCEGSRLHKEWWEEQFYYCENGYTTGGIYIPGVYYQYLNFQVISGLQGRIYPDFTDTHYRLYRIVDEIKRHNITGIIIPKARRKGVSLFGTSLANHGMRFIDDYRMGVAAGLEGYVTGFRNKLYASYNDCPPEMQIGHILKNKNEFKTGWEEEGSTGLIEVVTSLNSFRTMKGDATKLEGEYFHDVIAEEAGQFENVEAFLTSIRPTMDLGSYTMGTLFIYGTGGDTMKASKGFKNLWHAADSMGLIQWPILGPQYFFPYYVGATDVVGATLEEMKEFEDSFIKKGYDYSQVLGCEDPEAAEQKIKEERIRLAKNPNKKLLVEWNQKYPLNVEEIFTSSGSNNFDNDALYGQAYAVETDDTEIQKVVLEWVKDDKGNLIVPLQVTYRPAKSSDRDWTIAEMLRPPLPEMKDLDIGGIDGYNEDVSTTSKSLGCMNIARRFDEFLVPDEQKRAKPLKGRTIIFQYYKRPPRKEAFFEICLMASVLYNLQKNTMVSAEADLVIQFYKNHACTKYLSPRPKSFDSPNSELNNDYGAKMTVYSKPRMVGLLQSWVLDNIVWCFFLRTIQDLICYDDQNIGTDYDSADALGLILMRIEDMKKKPRLLEDKELNETLMLPSYQLGEDGIFEGGNEYKNLINELFR